jgi:SAM-dependent methyltransferase
MASDHADRIMNVAEAHKLDEPERLQWLPPDEVLRCLPLRKGMTVADVGAGTGYFAIPIARAIASDGRVFAVDLQQQMLNLLAGKLAAPVAPPNISLVQGGADATSLPAKSCDLAFMANVWHELPDHAAASRKTKRILKRRGTLAILDWRPDVQHPPGPPLEHRIHPDEVRRTVESHGWSCDPPMLVGRYGYIVLCRCFRASKPPLVIKRRADGHASKSGRH